MFFFSVESNQKKMFAITTIFTYFAMMVKENNNIENYNAIVNCKRAKIDDTTISLNDAKGKLNN